MHPIVLRLAIEHMHFKCLPLGDGSVLHSQFCKESQNAR